MSNCEKVVEELNAKVKEYEEILQTLLDENKPIIGVLKTNGFVEEGKTYYRCEVDSKDILVTFQKSFMFDKSALEVGKEVVIAAGSIVGTLPEALQPAKNKNKFPLISWNEVRGLNSQLAQIKENVQLPLMHLKLVKEFGFRPTKGMLLWGPPGCGKTLISKAIASEILKASEADDECFYYLKGGELLSKYVGETEAKIVSMFRRARTYSRKTGKRVVIFIDEAEAILPARGSKISSDVEKTIVPTFLSEMDGFDDNSPFILLATNFPRAIDAAVLREGRIDVKIEIGRPNKEDAMDIFKHHLGKMKIAEDIETLTRVGVELIYNSPVGQNVSGAMLETVANLAAQKALSRFICGDEKKKGIVEDDIQLTIQNLN
jgi:SpoVK/Ycf46/Vps4 family AAA+-type ATPase